MRRSVSAQIGYAQINVLPLLSPYQDQSIKSNYYFPTSSGTSGHYRALPVSRDVGVELNTV